MPRGCELTEEPVVFQYGSPRLAADGVASSEFCGTSDFSLTYARLCNAAGVRTMQELADLFQVRLSKISDVRRREKIPATWLYHLLLTQKISPQWIIYGTGPRELEFADKVDKAVADLLLKEVAV